MERYTVNRRSKRKSDGFLTKWRRKYAGGILRKHTWISSGYDLKVRNNTNTRVRRGFRAEQQIRYTYCKSLRLRIPTNEMRHFLNVTVLIIKSCLSILWMNKAIHITHVLYVKVGTYS